MIFLYILAVLVALVLIVSLGAFLIAFYCSDKQKAYLNDPKLPLEGAEYAEFNEVILNNVKKIEAHPCEEVTIKAKDGKKLFARYYHRGDGYPVEIFFHGYRANGVRDGSGSFGLSEEAGFNLLVVDQRSSGNSEGNVITFGVKEKLDVLAWVDYVINRFGKEVKIILAGISMGASTVLMASELDLPENVKCITADCGYSSQTEIIKKVGKEMKMPIKLLFPFLKLGALVFGGFNIDSRTPLDAVKNARVPIFFIHGDCDTFVPCHMCDELYDACTSPKRKLIVKNAAHGISFFVDHETYKDYLREFFRSSGVITNWER
ncbi:MAG: alpha/beta hydrolase [Oscillospiraceae bacterium]|nr:alpha/beta hydrolase [Oscillospiraceae bacterium]